MATEAARLKRKILGRKRQNNLSHTGLLMEGLGPPLVVELSRSALGGKRRWLSVRPIFGYYSREPHSGHFSGVGTCKASEAGKMPNTDRSDRGEGADARYLSTTCER
jgi:hypothetical protein